MRFGWIWLVVHFGMLWVQDIREDDWHGPNPIYPLKIAWPADIGDDNMSIAGTMHYWYVNHSFIIPVMHISVKHLVALCASYKLYFCLQFAQPSDFLTLIGHDIVGMGSILLPIPLVSRRLCSLFLGVPPILLDTARRCCIHCFPAGNYNQCKFSSLVLPVFLPRLQFH